MPATQVKTRDIGSVQRNDMDITTTGQAVVTKILPGTGVTIGSTGVDAGTGDVTINASGGGGGGMTWTVITASQTAAVDNGYITNAATRVVVTLPTTAAVGKIVRLANIGTGGWRLAQNASESIIFGNVTTTVGVGGYLESNHQRDAVEVICIVADTTWQVISSHGNITYV